MENVFQCPLSLSLFFSFSAFFFFLKENVHRDRTTKKYNPSALDLVHRWTPLPSKVNTRRQIFNLAHYWQIIASTIDKISQLENKYLSRIFLKHFQLMFRIRSRRILFVQTDSSLGTLGTDSLIGNHVALKRLSSAGPKLTSWGLVVQ